MTIEPTEFDLVALARRGLQALFDEALAEIRFATDFAVVDKTTGQWAPESLEARDTAFQTAHEAWVRLSRFSVLHPEPGTFEA